MRSKSNLWDCIAHSIEIDSQVVPLTVCVALPPLLTAEDTVSLLQRPHRLSNKPSALNRGTRFWIRGIKVSGTWGWIQNSGAPPWWHDLLQQSTLSDLEGRRRKEVRHLWMSFWASRSAKGHWQVTCLLCGCWIVRNTDLYSCVGTPPSSPPPKPTTSHLTGPTVPCPHLLYRTASWIKAFYR